MRNKPILAIVSPCYKEQEALPHSAPVFIHYLNKWINEGLIADSSFVLLVDDGSPDSTWDIVENFHKKNPHRIKGLKLAQNVGHQHALFAGLSFVNDKCDCSISIDADLQDDIKASEQMILEYLKGKDIVFGVRNARDSDTAFKRVTARGFYSFMHLLGVKVVYDHADYRLLSASALKNLTAYNEQHLFLRGMAILASKNSSIVYYDRNPRVAGESKYPLSKMLSFAWDGITSFSTKPLQYIANLGIVVCLLSGVLGIYSLARHFSGNTIPGWTSLVISIYFISGVQLLSIGIIGQYVGKIYLETKNRPRYFVDRNLF